MKTIYLRDENYNWKGVVYSNVNDLSLNLSAIGINIGNDVKIGDLAKIGYDVTIGYGATIGDLATIGNGIKIITGFYISGSKDSVTYVGDSKVSIGCHCLKISNWKKNFKTIGIKECYSELQIEEYKQYILMVDKFSKIKLG